MTAEIELLDVKGAAAILKCSSRTVYRLCDSGQMPAPVRVGRLVRWRREIVAEWIAAGCPRVRRETGQK